MQIRLYSKESKPHKVIPSPAKSDLVCNMARYIPEYGRPFTVHQDENGYYCENEKGVIIR